MWSVLKLASRAAIWRTTSNPRLVGLPSLLMWMIGIAALRIAFQFVAAGPGGGFNPYGLNAVVAWLALEVAVAALFVPPGARTTALAAMFALSIAAELAMNAVKIAAASVMPLAVADALWRDRGTPLAIFAVVSVWWIGAMVAVLRSFAPQPRFPVLGRVATLWLALVAVSALIPHAPVFVAADFDIRAANLWESLHARLQASPEARDEAAHFEQSQHALLQAEVARLAPPTKGATNVYAMGVAGWADQDVFLKELDGGLAAIGGVADQGAHAASR